jgi:hypothetical protein
MPRKTVKSSPESHGRHKTNGVRTTFLTIAGVALLLGLVLNLPGKAEVPTQTDNSQAWIDYISANCSEAGYISTQNGSIRAYVPTKCGESRLTDLVIHETADPNQPDRASVEVSPMINREGRVVGFDVGNITINENPNNSDMPIEEKGAKAVKEASAVPAVDWLVKDGAFENATPQEKITIIDGLPAIIMAKIIPDSLSTIGKPESELMQLWRSIPDDPEHLLDSCATYVFIQKLSDEGLIVKGDVAIPQDCH